MQDFLIRGLTQDGFVKVAAVQSTSIVERMRNIHKTLPLATAALGRTLTAASMMGNEIKSEGGSVTVQIRGNGPLGAITAVSDSNGNVRGYLQNPAVSIPLKPNGKLDVCGGVGADGILTVIKDTHAGEPFSGKVELQSGEIAEDIAAYYAISEQIPTVCALGVLVGTDQSVSCAGGYIIQLMPGAPDELIDTLETRLSAFGSVTSRLSAGLDIEAVVCELLDGMSYKTAEKHDVSYECKCSQKRVEQALISLGRAELEKLIEQDEVTRVTCQFCDIEYSFEREALKKLIR